MVEGEDGNENLRGLIPGSNQVNYEHLVKVDKWTGEVKVCFPRIDKGEYTCLSRLANKNPPPRPQPKPQPKPAPKESDCHADPDLPDVMKDDCF
jgi:hypothetical protein